MEVMPALPNASRPARKRSKASLDGILTGWAVGFSSMTGLPWRVMTTSSPDIALSIRLGSRFLASATL
jgi:hypothetical protein